MKQDSKKRSGDFVRIRIWFGGYKQACAVNTLKSHISNMIVGVTEVSNHQQGASNHQYDRQQDSNTFGVSLFSVSLCLS